MVTHVATSSVTSVGMRELHHHTSRYLAQVKAGRTLKITERGRVVAVLSPPADVDTPSGRPRPRIGGYRSGRPLTAEEIDAELARGFGDDDGRRRHQRRPRGIMDRYRDLDIGVADASLGVIAARAQTGAHPDH